ncbi:MAG TPA: acyltransferase family protein [Bacillales bacterium]|nr:acyltransferase family protein [Bacillales bacterium]
MNNNREAYFDNAKWIMIILVVFGHVISPMKQDNSSLYSLYTTIYLLHMPGFILISGYFAKQYREKGYLKKIARKTLLPYVIFQLMYGVFYFGIDYMLGNKATLDLGIFKPHFTLWFLVSLFCWNVLLFLYARFRWWIVFAAFAAGIAIGYMDDVNKFLSVARTFVYFPFFLIGFYLKPEFFKKLRNLPWQIVGAVTIGVVLTTFFFYSPEGITKWLECAFSYAKMGTGGWEAGLIRLGQYALMLLATFSFLALIPGKRLSMTVFGTRTLYVYLLHGFIIQAMRHSISDSTFDAISGHILFLLAVALGISLVLATRTTKKFTRPLVELRA